MPRKKSTKTSEPVEGTESESALYLDDITPGIERRRIRPPHLQTSSQTSPKKAASATSRLSERRNAPPKLRFVGPQLDPKVGKWTNGQNFSDEIDGLSHILDEIRSPGGSNGNIGLCISSPKPRPIKPSQLQVVLSPKELEKSPQKPTSPQKTPSNPENSPKKPAESPIFAKIKVEIEDPPKIVEEEPVNLRNTIKQEPTEPIISLAALFRDLPDFENTENLGAPSEKSTEIDGNLGISPKNRAEIDGQGSQRNGGGLGDSNLANPSGKNPKNANLESSVLMDNIENAPKPAKKKVGRPRKDQKAEKPKFGRNGRVAKKYKSKIMLARQRMENARKAKAKNKELVEKAKANRSRLSQASKNSDGSDDVQNLDVPFVPIDSQVRLVEDITKSESVVDEGEVEKLEKTIAVKEEIPSCCDEKSDRSRCEITPQFGPKTPTMSAETIETIEKESKATHEVKEVPKIQPASTPEIEILSGPPKRRGIVPGRHPRGVFRLRKPVEGSTMPIAPTGVFTVPPNGRGFRISREIPLKRPSHLVQYNFNGISRCSSGPAPSNVPVQRRTSPRKSGNPENSKILPADPSKSSLAENEKIGNTAPKSGYFPLINVRTETGRTKNFVERPISPSYPEVLYPPGEWKKCAVCRRSLPPFIHAPTEKHALLQWSYRLGTNLLRKRDAVFVCRQHFCSDEEQRNGTPPKIENPLFVVPNSLENTRRTRVHGRRGVKWDDLVFEVKKFENWKEILEKYEKLNENQPNLLSNKRNEPEKGKLPSSAVFKKVFVKVSCPDNVKLAVDRAPLIDSSRLRPGLAQAIMAKSWVLEKMPKAQRRALEAQLNATQQKEEVKKVAKQLDEWTENSILMPENVAINEEVGTSGIIPTKQKISPKPTWKQLFLARMRERKKKMTEVINLEQNEAQKEPVETVPEAKIPENRKRKRKEAVVMDDDEDIVVIRYANMQEPENHRKNVKEILKSASIEEMLNVQVKDWLDGGKNSRV
uniref:[Histone H3]-lysine(4) N-trimethyltransferase n=1 Tax=Bursaphelenchus xylophilus TaxID=6326 RepID=A0A1I7SAK2_BURXY